MEDKNKKILTETIQFYFDQREISETVQFQFHERETGRVMVELHTGALISYKDLVFIEKLVWALMPMGINYELINVVKNVQGDTETEIKSTTEEIRTTITKTVEISQPVLPEEPAKQNRVYANIDTSTDVTMFPGKKKE